jgi:NAD(P)-dependent dehydrogenase (short-subunit alcohol dehydrogenase family)
MNDLNGRTAVITGASSGVGAALATALASAGVQLGLLSRRVDDLGIEDAVMRPCDVRDLTQLEESLAAIHERFGAIDILVANAGVGAYGEFLDLDRAVLDEILDVNVRGLLYTIRAGLPYLLESDAAELVTVASVAGQRAPEGEAAYAASKFAQVGFMRSLDHELWPRGVRCSIVCPGGIATDFALGRGRELDDPDRPGMMTAEEVADSIIFALTRPRTHRVLESNLFPMADDSMN